MQLFFAFLSLATHNVLGAILAGPFAAPGILNYFTGGRSALVWLVV